MHSGGKGISKSSVPYKRSQASWLKVSAPQVEELVIKLAKKGLTPSQIGVILRDQHGIAQVKSVTGTKTLRILKKAGILKHHLIHAYNYTQCAGLAPSIPEDLYMLIKKAVSVRKHLERNKKDKDSKFRLILVESRIHRYDIKLKLLEHAHFNNLSSISFGVTTIKLLVLHFDS